MVFWTFWTFEYFRKVSCRIWDFGFNLKNRLWKAHLLMLLNCFKTESNGLQKRLNFDFWSFFWKFLTARELPSQIWDFGLNRNYKLRESLLHERLRSVSHKKRWFSELSIFWFVDRFCIFLANYAADSDSICSIEATDCWTPAFKIGYAQFVQEKSCSFETCQRFDTWTVFWKLCDFCSAGLC